MLLPSQKWRLHILAILVGSIRSGSIVKLIFVVIIEISGSALPNLGISEYLHGSSQQLVVFYSLQIKFAIFFVWQFKVFQEMSVRGGEILRSQ